MRKLVVCTSRGDVIKEEDLDDPKLVGAVGAWLTALPECALYLDGELMTDEARTVMKELATRAKAAASESAPQMAPVTPEQIKDFADVLRLIFDDVRSGASRSGVGCRRL